VTTPALRPRSATEIIDIAFQVLRHNYGALVTLSVASMLPLALLAVISPSATAGFRVATGAASAPPAVDGAYVVFSIIAAVFYMAAQNAVTVGASQAYLGQPVQAGVALRRGARRLLPLILVSIVAMVPVMIGFLFFILPGLYLILRFVPLPMVTVLEDGDPGETFKRTWSLSRDNVGHILVLVLVMFAIYMAVAFISMFLLFASASVFTTGSAVGAASILYYAVIALFYPFFQMILVALYYDLRIRHEGLDVEMLTQALGEPAPQT
jgi:hypothetical protein